MEQEQYVKKANTSLGPVYMGSDPNGIGSIWIRSIHLDPIHFLRGVYTGSDPELLAFTQDRIHLDLMSYPYRFVSDPTHLHETFMGSDPNGITFESDSSLGTDSRSKWVRIRSVPCKRKAYLLHFGYGSIWI